MAEASQEKTQVEIPYGLVEYTAFFTRSILETWPANAALIAHILDVLGPFGFTLDEVEVSTQTQKISEYAIHFRRKNPNVTFTFQLGKLVILADNLDWTEAEQF